MTENKVRDVDEYIGRQMSLLRNLISDYRASRIQLNTLVQRIEGLSAAIGIGSWSSTVFPIVVKMEQINAAALELHAKLTSEDQVVIDNALTELEELTQRFYGGQ